MDLTHDFTVPAGLDETWAAFNHLELVTACFPGGTLTSVDGQDFTGGLKGKLGPTAVAYVGTGRFLERHVGGRHTVVEATGNELRGKGTVTARITSSFTEAGAGTTVHVRTRLTFTGPPAQLSSGVVEDAVDRLVAQFAEEISARFAQGLGAEALAADADSAYASPIGTPASSSSKMYAYHPPHVASQTDWDLFVRVAPTVAKRAVPVLLGGLVVLGVVRSVRRR